MEIKEMFAVVEHRDMEFCISQNFDIHRYWINIGTTFSIDFLENNRCLLKNLLKTNYYRKT